MISVVIPVYNEGAWLITTLDKLQQAVSELKTFSTEIIIVNDGSTDNTQNILEGLALDYKNSLNIKVISQKNLGRYKARSAGINLATGDFLLLIDARVHIARSSLRYAESKIKTGKLVWNAHVYIKRENYLSSFWDVIAHIAWRRYFMNPRETSYGIEEFDYFPKGTTCFLCPTPVMIESMKDFSKQHSGGNRSNDDTSLLKFIAVRQKINISPKFSCTYHARGTMIKFIKHSYHRGQVFVDGFLRPGNRYFPVLLGFLLMPFLLIPMFLFLEVVSVWLLMFIIFAYITLPLSLVGLFKINFQKSLDFVVVLPVFLIAYGSGIWRAVITKMLPMPRK